MSSAVATPPLPNAAVPAAPPPLPTPPVVPAPAPFPLRAFAMLRKVTVPEYHRMIAAGILTEDDPIELLEGYLVLKMPRNPAHDGTIDLARTALTPLLPEGWVLRSQQAISVDDSEPEPDFACVRGDERTYLGRHPVPSDVGLVIEVANTSLDRDRTDKARIYAHGGISLYWIVNLLEGKVEVYSQPSGPAAAPSYGQKSEYRVGSDVPIVLDGHVVATVPAARLLP